MLVVTPDPLVARWACEPIVLGPGSVIMDAQETAHDLQLAALSVVAHGKGDVDDVDIAVKIAAALSKAIDALPGADQWLYLSLIDNALAKAAKEKLHQMMPEVPKYFSETLRRSLDTYVAEGEAKGKAEGVAVGEVKALLKIWRSAGWRCRMTSSAGSANARMSPRSMPGSIARYR